MHILSAIKHDLGIIEGILIPGASAATTATTHAIQQQVANAYGAAIGKAVQDLAPRTDLSGPQKGIVIANAVASDMVAKSFKGELEHLRDIVVDVVQAAYRAVEPNIGSIVLGVASALHLSGALETVVELAAPAFQAGADKLRPAAAAEAPVAA